MCTPPISGSSRDQGPGMVLPELISPQRPTENPTREKTGRLKHNISPSKLPIKARISRKCSVQRPKDAVSKSTDALARLNTIISQHKRLPINARFDLKRAGDSFPLFFSPEHLKLPNEERNLYIRNRTEEIVKLLPEELQKWFPTDPEEILQSTDHFALLLQTSLAFSRITLANALGGEPLEARQETREGLFEHEKRAIDHITHSGTSPETTLLLDNKSLAALPPEIGLLTSLVRLGCDNNALVTLPSQIKHLTRLESLDLRGNHIEWLPSEFSTLQALTSLNLCKNSLDSLPPEICALPSLQCLFLRENNLKYLPPIIGKLKTLRSLNIDNNQLDSLPHELMGLSSLLALCARGNNLRSLPSTIGRLIALKSLWVDDNFLPSLPPGVCNLTSLECLSISDNLLSSLPGGFENLSSLQEFYFQRNRFSQGFAIYLSAWISRINSSVSTKVQERPAKTKKGLAEAQKRPAKKQKEPKAQKKTTKVHRAPVKAQKASSRTKKRKGQSR